MKDAEISNNFLKDSLNFISQLDPINCTGHYSYLIDFVLGSSNPSKSVIEKLYEDVTNVLETGGYGANIDQAKLITLRRRWWTLHFMVNTRPWFNTLGLDLKLWSNLKMFNEIRELQSNIGRRHLLKKKQDIDYILSLATTSK